MEKSVGIILMVLFGISGVVATALAWLYPALDLNRAMATLAGIIGVSFTVFQTVRFRRGGHNDEDAVSVDIPAEEKR